MKDTYYFPHDFNARNDEKILKIRTKFENEKGYGLFWMIAEIMAESSDGYIDGQAMAELSFCLHIDENYIQQYLDFCVSIGLFFSENGRISSERIQQHKAFRRSLSDAGKHGAKARWPGYSHVNSPPNSHPNAKERKGKEKKRKEKKRNKIKEKNIYIEFVQLTQEENKKLIDRYGKHRTMQMIERLNNYLGSTGKRYKSHYHTILTWADRDLEKEKPVIQWPEKPPEFSQSVEDKEKVRDLIHTTAEKIKKKA